MSDHQPGPPTQSAASAVRSSSRVGGAGFGGGFVEDRQLGVGQQQAGERDLLCLGVGELMPADADERVQSVGEQVEDRGGAGGSSAFTDVAVGGRRNPSSKATRRSTSAE